MNIALCMIVKNESHVIRRCIDSVLPFINYVYIEDTGSTDGTPQVVEDHLKAKSVPGHVHVTKWQDFATNRSEALRRGRMIPNIDYLLMIDADEVLVFESVEVVQRLQEIKDAMVLDCYNIETRMGGASYERPQITSTKKEFYYKGVVHEFLDCKTEFTTGKVCNIFNKPIQDSSRNQDPKKFEKDALALEEALKKETDPQLVSRYTFYCAQSWRDANVLDKALKYYRLSAKLCKWDEERYWSHYQAGRMMKQLGGFKPEEIFIEFMKGHEANPKRGEAACEVLRLCREQKWWQLGYMIGFQVIFLKPPAGALFSEQWVYDYSIKDEFSVISYWAGDYRMSKRLSEELLRENKYPQTYGDRIKENLKFANQKITN